MSNQDIDGNVPGDAEPTAPAGTPQYFEQQLAREREARAQLRERLRNTEALAAESHALRARMAQELERVTAERDRLRSAVAAAPSVGGASMARPSGVNTSTAASAATAGASAESAPVDESMRAARAAPPMTPRFSERPFKPPAPPRRKAPWFALAMLAGLAVGVAALAWVTGSIPGFGSVTTALAPATTPSDAASAPVVAAATPTTLPAASAALASAAQSPARAPVPSSNGAVALAPLTPEAQLAATPTAAGNTSTAQPAVQPAAPSAALPPRLRAALDAEGIVAPVDVDPATGRVAVSDPAADTAARDRTDTIIRAVYAGASLPEPQIEHRWVSPPRAGRVASAAQPVPDATAPVAVAKTSAHATSAHATSARAPEHARHAQTLAAAQEEPTSLPAGRFTTSCKASVAGDPVADRGAEVLACMKRSCCSSANRQTDECRAYNKGHPHACSAG